MEKDPIALAAKLLVKAQATTFDAEAAALTGRAYRLLAQALNAHDEATPAGAARKRERRHLRDRRSTPRPSAPSVPHRSSQAAAADEQYHDQWPDLPTRGLVDLMI
jgi:hypothetical protein